MSDTAWYAVISRASHGVVTVIRPSIDRLLKILNFSPRHIAAQALDNGGVCLRVNIPLTDCPDELAARSVLLQLVSNGRTVRVLFPAERSSYYAKHFSIEPYQTNGMGVAYVDPYDLRDLCAAVCRDLEERLLHYPPAFNQCSDYKKCRSAGYCVAHDQDAAAGCAYKRTLYRGLSYFKGISSV